LLYEKSANKGKAMKATKKLTINNIFMITSPKNFLSRKDEFCRAGGSGTPGSPADFLLAGQPDHSVRTTRPTFLSKN
jgi:hypothetical protein